MNHYAQACLIIHISCDMLIVLLLTRQAVAKIPTKKWEIFSLYLDAPAKAGSKTSVQSQPLELHA